MSSGKELAPVIIKKKRIVQADGHHGGAWKVAYADFVTAMMAFFMLMWLLNATTEKQRKGIADYFSPTVPISGVSSGSDGVFDGDSVFVEDVLPSIGSGASALDPAQKSSQGGPAYGGESDAQSAALSKAEELFVSLGGESMESDNFLRHVITRVTDEGLVFELYDIDGDPLFTEESKPSDSLKLLLTRVMNATSELENEIAIHAHVASFPIVKRDDPAWELSSERAFTVGSVLQDKGLEDDRIQRVTAYGDRKPLVRNTMDVRNNRIEIVFLRK